MNDGATAVNDGADEFVGRRWALQRIQHWWHRTADPVLVVTGGPGVGKTSLIKEWVRTAPRAPSRGDDRVIHAVGYAAARTDTGYPAGLLEAVSSQLADRIKAYGELLPRQAGIEQNIRINQVARRVEGALSMTGVHNTILVGRRFRWEDYHRLMRAPFEKLHREGRLPVGGVTVVIDGLDEVAADRDDDGTFAEAVADAHPVPGLRLLLTTRTGPATGPLRRFPSFDLVDDEPPTSSDLADFVTARLAPVPGPLRVRLVGRVVEHCAGRFGHARVWAEHITTAYRDNPAELATLEQLPPPAGVAEAWRTLLDKLGGSASARRQRHLPVLRIAALARDDGLPGEVLRAAVGRYHPDLAPQLGAILDELRDFFRPVDHPGGPHRLRDVSLEEYLTGTPERPAPERPAPERPASEDAIVVAHGQLAIAQVLAERTRWNGGDDAVAGYARKHLLTHLVAAIPADRTAVHRLSQELLGQLEFVEAVTRRLGVERFQWELERLAAAFDHQVWAVNELAFLLGRQIAQLRDIDSEADEGFLLRQLLHAARACGADTAEDYRRGLVARSPGGLETVWATGGQELASSVREFEHGPAPVGAVAMVDERRLVTVSDDGSAWLWDVRSGQRRSLPADGSRIRAVAASANWVLTGSGRGTVQVWNVPADAPGPSLPGPPDPVLALAILPDGERGVCLSRSGLVRVWRLRDARRVHRVEVVEVTGPAPAERAAYRPTIMAVAGGRVLTAAANGCVVVTDLQGSDLQGSARQLVLRHTGDELTAAALSSDGRYAATGGADGSVIWWELTDGRPHRLPDAARPSNPRADPAATAQAGSGVPPSMGVDSGITALVVSGDGRFVVAGSGAGARLWDTARDSGALLMGDAGVSALALVPGDRQVVTASLDHRLRLWSLSSRRLLHLFPGHRDRVRSLAMDASGHRLVSASYDGTARLWHVPVAAEREILPGHPARLAAMSLTADEAGLVTADLDGTVWRRNLADGRGGAPGRSSPSPVTALLPGPPGAGEPQVVVGTADGTTGGWDLPAATLLTVVDPGSARVTALVAVSADWAVATYADGLARLWHRRTAASLRCIRHHSGLTAAAAAVLNGAPVVLLAAEDHTVRLWDLKSGTWRWARSDHEMKVATIAVCPDPGGADPGSADPGAGDEHAVTAALDGTVRLWRVSDGTSWGMDTAHRAEATAVATGPGGLAVSGADDGSAIVWDLRERTARHHLDHGPAVDAVRTVAFTPSGHHVLTGATDGGVRLWDITMAGRRLTRPHLRLMLAGPVTQLLVTPAGDRAVVGTETGQLSCVRLP